MKLPDIIGLPPDPVIESRNMLLNSFPIVDLVPAEPDFEMGIQLFRARPAWGEYESALKKYGFSLSRRNSVKVAFRAETFTEDFVSEYGESFLSKLTDFVSSGIGDLAYITGTRTMEQVLKAAVSGKEAIKNIPVLGTAVGIASEIASGTLGAMAVGAEALGVGKYFTEATDLVSKALLGQRLEFPLVWKNSSHSPTYDFTVQLYNPKPKDPNYTMNYIIGPLAALLLFVLPRSKEGLMYNWPFLCIAKCPGIFHVNPGAVTSVTVSKNLESFTAFNQQIAFLEVRVTLKPLFSVMVHVEEEERGQMPTLKKYIKAMKETKPTYPVHSLGSQGGQRSAREIRRERRQGLTTTNRVSSDLDLVPSRVSEKDQEILQSLQNLH